MEPLGTATAGLGFEAAGTVALLAGRVPPEIVRLIFELGMTTTEDPLARVRFVLRLCAVCRAWKTTTEDMPVLWTTIYVSVPHAPPILTLETIVARSGHRPLDIYVDWGCRWPRRRHPRPLFKEPWLVDEHYIKKVQDVLRREITRWYSLDLGWNPWGCHFAEADLIDMLHGQADSLEHLRYQTSYAAESDTEAENYYQYAYDSEEEDEEGRSDDSEGSYPYEDHCPYFVLLFTERLRTACFDCAPENFNLRGFRRYQGTIESLTWIAAHKFHHLEQTERFLLSLSRFGRLRHVAIHRYGIVKPDRDGVLYVTPQLVFPVLEELEFTDNHMPVIKTMLDIIVAPNLQRLTVRGPIEIASPPESISMVDLSEPKSRFPSLHTLHFEPQVGHMPDVEGLWCDFAFLRTIQVKFIGTAGTLCGMQMLQQLSVPDQEEEGGWLFPKLKSLSVAFTSESGMTVDPIRCLVDSRLAAESTQKDSGSVSRLRALKVCTPLDIGQESLDVLQKALDEFSCNIDIPAVWKADTRHYKHTKQFLGIELVNDVA